MKAISFILFILFFFAAPAQKNTRAAKDNLPVPKGYVNDFAHILSVKENGQLTETIAEFDSSTTNQIAVVTINSTLPLTIEDFAKKLFNKWGIGQKEKNNGVLVLIAYKDRKVRIATGSGIQTALTDSLCKEIIDEILVPHFKENELYEGIRSAIEQVKVILADKLAVNSTGNFSINPHFQDYSPTIPTKKSDNNGFWLTTLLGSGIILLIAGISFFRQSMPRVSLTGEGADNYYGFGNIKNHHYDTTDNSSYITMSSSFDSGTSSSIDTDSSSSSGGLSGGSTDGSGFSGSW